MEKFKKGQRVKVRDDAKLARGLEGTVRYATDSHVDVVLDEDLRRTPTLFYPKELQAL